MGKDDMHNMMGLDVYLSTLSEAEYNSTRQKLRHAESRFPLTSWDIFADGYRQTITDAIRLRDSEMLEQLAKKYSWSFNPVQLLQEPYQAIIVTDNHLKILWINPGFTDMTGYAAKHALGRTPKFLQGANTKETSRQEFRRQLDVGEPFKAVITNYRKNQEEYLCEVKICPLRDINGHTSHYIALEQEIA